MAVSTTALQNITQVPSDPPATKALIDARSLYFTGDALASAHAFETAVKSSSMDATAWLDGSIAWAESGDPEKAVSWARHAVTVSSDTRTFTALGWALLRIARPEEALSAFTSALLKDSESAWAVLGAGRAQLELGRTIDAVALLKRAEGYALQQTLANYYLGRAYEAMGDSAESVEALKRAVISDSYFHEGRDPLMRAYLRQKRYNDAWRQMSRLAEVEPNGRFTRAMMDKIRPLVLASAEALKGPTGRSPITAPDVDSETDRGIPVIRVGIATTPLGKPRPRVSVTVRGSRPWITVDPKTGKTIAACGAQESWTVRLVPPQKIAAKGKLKKRTIPAHLELRGPDGQVHNIPGEIVNLQPEDGARGTLSLEDDPNKGGPLAAGRAMRGAIEVAMFAHRRSLRLVNIVNLEDYTEGVVGAEMPSASPMEALKAQALIARTHALFIKKVTKRHKKEGYDVCDEQHCQVYAGIHMETPRTRVAVAATHGRVVLYKGQLAHVIYSSNCGGATQSGRDIGWGNVAYWSRTVDAPKPSPYPDSPSDLRRWLLTWPQDHYCQPSGYVHPSHSRWSRVISAKELEDRVNRHRKIGTLKGLRVLRRAPSGHVESLLILGSKRNLKLTDEYEIRSLLVTGSLRSTLFIVDTEYRATTLPAPKPKKGLKPGKPQIVLVPDAFVFRGGGWGHAVGLCQSGAIGRAESGQDYEAIVKAYFAGVELAKLDY